MEDGLQPAHWSDVRGHLSCVVDGNHPDPRLRCVPEVGCTDHVGLLNATLEAGRISAHRSRMGKESGRMGKESGRGGASCSVAETSVPGVPASGMVPLGILTPPMGRIDGCWSCNSSDSTGGVTNPPRSQSSNGAGGLAAPPMRWCRWSLE